MVHRSSFTLIELLAVMVVIVMLTALTLAVSSYVRRQLARSTARSQIAALAVALEAYKSDWGYYPRTGPARLSADGAKEASNNCTLLNALCSTNLASGQKVYLRFPAAQIRHNPAPNIAGLNLPGLPNLYDPWGKPYVYYNSPATPFGFISTCTNLIPIGSAIAIGNGYTVGGQVNGTSFDLFSFGPDRYTYVPGAPSTTNCSGPAINSWNQNGVGLPWTNKTAAADDITNWSR